MRKLRADIRLASEMGLVLGKRSLLQCTVPQRQG